MTREQYSDQFDAVMQVIRQAYENDECNSLLLLSRSRHVIHSFLTLMEEEVVRELIEDGTGRELKFCRVNSILNNSEPKIFVKFTEALGIKDQANKHQTVEMIETVAEMFKQNSNLCVIFVLEEVDHYIETTRQTMLYKILDMLQYAKIPFVFLATS